MGHTFSCRTFLSKISTIQTCTSTPSTHLNPTPLTTHFTLKSATPKNVTPCQTFTIKWVTLIQCHTFLSKISISQTPTINGSHLVMLHFWSKIYINIIAVKPPQYMGHTYPCHTFLSKIFIFV